MLTFELTISQTGHMQTTAADAVRHRMQIRRDLPTPADRRALRVAAGLTTAELGTAVGVSKQAITSWENGTRTPRGICLERYVDALRALRDEIAKVA